MASQDTLAIFLPTDGIPPAASYATLDIRNGHMVLDFDGVGAEEIHFAGVLPKAYGGGGLTVRLWIGFTTATSGTSSWRVDIERIQAGTLDIDADSFASAQTGSLAANATSGIFDVLDIAFTSGAQMDSLVAGEAYRLRVRRDPSGASGTDDITTDAELLRVAVRET